MAANKNIVVRLLADASQYEATMAKAGASTKELAGGLEKTGSKTGLIATGLTAAGLAAAAFGVAAVKMTADFDQQMSTVQANTGATSAELEMLRQAAIEAGADTVYSASESASAINDLGKAGMSTADILSGGLKGALDLAASDSMDVGEAAEYMASALTMFHLEGSQATAVADALAAGAGKAVGGVSDFGEALNNCGGSAYSFGMSMQETVGVLGLFAQNGIVGAEAGTQLNSMLMKLSNPASDAKATMEQLGISAYDASGKFVGMANFAGQLQEAEKNLTQEQRNQANATMFGSYAIKAANYLYQAGAAGVEEWTKNVSDSGYAAEMAAQKNDNLKGDLENLSGSFESLMLKIGEGGQGPIRKLVQGLDTMVDAFGQLPSGVQQTMVLLAGLGGVMGVVHKAATPLNTSTSKVAQTLGLVVDPIQRVNSALPQLKSGFGDLASVAATSWQSLSTGTPVIGRSAAAMNGLKSISSGVIDLLGGPWGIALGVAAAAMNAWVANAQRMNQEADSIQSALESTGDATEAMVDLVQQMEVGDNASSFGLLKKIEQMITGADKLTDVLDEAGVSIDTFVKAGKGDKDALAEVNAAIEKFNGSLGSGTHKAQAMRQGLEELQKAYQDGTKDAKDKTDAMDALTDSEESAADATDGTTSSIENESDAADDATDKIDDLVKSLFDLESGNLSADEAVTSMRQKILSLNDSISENGRVLDENGNALGGYEEKAYSSQSALQSLAESAQNAATKILQEGQASDDMAGATQRAGDALEEARNSFINNAIASGMSEEAANRLASAYGLERGKVDELKSSIDAVPNNKNTNYTTSGWENAYAQASSLADMIRGIPEHKTTFIEVYQKSTGQTVDRNFGVGSGVRTDGGYTGGVFDGSRFTRYASGGLAAFEGYANPSWAPGTGKSDSVWLTNARIARGEFVTNAEAVSHYGLDIMSAMNRQAVPRELFSKAPQQPIVVQVPQQQAQNVELNMPVKVVRASSDLDSASTILTRNALKEVRNLR